MKVFIANEFSSHMSCDKIGMLPSALMPDTSLETAIG